MRSILLALLLACAACSSTEDGSSPAADCFGNCCQSVAPANAKEQCAGLGLPQAYPEPYQCSGLARPGPDGREPAQLMTDGTCQGITNSAGHLLCCKSKL